MKNFLIIQLCFYTIIKVKILNRVEKLIWKEGERIQTIKIYR